MVKPGENTEESWVLPSTTECRERRLTHSIDIDLRTHRYQMVWTETSKTYHDMASAEGWTDKREISVPVVQSFTFKVCA